MMTIERAGGTSGVAHPPGRGPRARALALAMSLSLLGALLLAGGVHAQGTDGDPAKRADIRRLLTLTGSDKLGLQVMNSLVQTFQSANPDVPPEFWQEFMAGVDAQELIALIVPVYDRHLSHKEVLGVIAFYETPVGQKLIGVLPQITQESMAAGQQWGTELAQRAIKSLQARQQQ